MCSIFPFSSSYLIFTRISSLSWNSGPRLPFQLPLFILHQVYPVLQPQETCCHFQNRPCLFPPLIYSRVFPFLNTLPLTLSDSFSSLKIQWAPLKHLYWFPQGELGNSSSELPQQPVQSASFLTCLVLLTRSWRFLRVRVRSYCIYSPHCQHFTQCLAGCGHTIIVLGISVPGSLGP